MRDSLPCPLYSNAQTVGRHPALIHLDQTVSFRDLHNRVCLATQELQALGVREHDHVGVLSPNSVNFLVILFALWRCKAVACFLNTRLPMEAVKKQLTEFQCAFFLSASPEYLNSERIPIPQKGFHEVCRNKYARRQENNVQGVEYPLDQEMTVMFTSGSGRRPKAAVHTFGNHFYSALGSNEHIPVKKGDRWLLSLPLYHVGGLGIVFRAFLGGGAVVIGDSKQDLLSAIRGNNITHVSAVSTQLYRLLNDGKNADILRRLKVILLGGSAVPDTLIRESIDERLPLYVTYGLTEMASQVATSRRLTKENPLVEAKVLNYREVSVSDEKEILVKGETLFKGYLQDGRLSIPLDPRGWFKTGDLGCFNEDGTLNVLGRKDNMFISGGENIQPEEIEHHLSRMENIVHALVVPVKDEEFGARPVAFIEAPQHCQIERTRIVSFLQGCLPRFKVPDEFYYWPEGPQSGGLKFDRVYFAELVSSQKEKLAVIP